MIYFCIRHILFHHHTQTHREAHLPFALSGLKGQCVSGKAVVESPQLIKGHLYSDQTHIDTTYTSIHTFMHRRRGSHSTFTPCLRNDKWSCGPTCKLKDNTLSSEPVNMRYNKPEFRLSLVHDVGNEAFLVFFFPPLMNVS